MMIIKLLSDITLVLKAVLKLLLYSPKYTECILSALHLIIGEQLILPQNRQNSKLQNSKNIPANKKKKSLKHIIQ